MSTGSLAIAPPSSSSTQFWSSSSKLNPTCACPHAYTHVHTCAHVCTPLQHRSGPVPPARASCWHGRRGGAIGAAAPCPSEGLCHPCKHGTLAFPETRWPELNAKFRLSPRCSAARCVRCAADLQAAGVKQMSCAEHHVALGGFARGVCHPLLPFCFCSLSKPFKAPCVVCRILRSGLNREISRGAVFLYAQGGEVVCIRAVLYFFSSPCSLITEDYSDEAAGDISCRCGIRPS